MLDATLAPHERAVVAGHSMGGITIAAWSERYRHKVPRRADAVALINTTSGDLIRNVQLLAVPHGLSPARVFAGRTLISAFGGFPVPGAARIPSRYVVAMLATGRDADPSIARLVYELFEKTSPWAGRLRAGAGRVDGVALSRPERVDGADAGHRQRTRPADTDRPVPQDRT